MVPIGGIIQWSGALNAIPTSYQLCDGTNGTPDLTDKFILGAGSSFIVDQEGGDLMHTHTSGGNVQVTDGIGPFVYTNIPTSEESNMPPFYALAHIQRMM